MADTTEKKIFQALTKAMQDFGLPTGITLVTPSQTFTPQATSKFVSIEIHFNRSIETDLSLDMDPIRQGFMRANVMWPKGSGIVDAYDIAGRIRAYLRRGSKLYQGHVQVRIDEDPELSMLVTGDTHFTVPVTIRWLCFFQPA